MENEFYRFEFKYELEPSTALAIETELKKHGMKLDMVFHEGKEEYHVTSLYFDSSDLSDYYDKMGGFLKRKKLRARIYEPFLKNSDIVWLEIKSKHDMKVHKKRFALTRNEWEKFLNRGASSLLKTTRPGKESIKNEIIWNFLNSPVKPTALVKYIRKPYVLGNLRITFDSQLKTCKKTDLNYTKTTTKVPNKGVIMEIKFNYLLPFWFKNIIKNHNLKRQAFSKYSLSVDSLHRHDPLPK